MTSTEQLERETEQTRARLAETLEELKTMTPGRVLDEVLDYAKEGGGDLLRGLGRQVSENPMPAALIGAGLVWMMMGHGKTNGSSAPRVNGDGRSTGETFSSAADSAIAMGSDLGTRAGEIGSDLGSKASDAARSVKETMQSAASGVSETASMLKDKASSAYESVADTASRTKWAVKDAAYSVKESAAALEESAVAATRGLFDFCKDQPLVLAGLGLAIGAALGAAIPETEAEDRLMGETADQLKQQAQALASDQLQMAKQVGQHMVDETAKIAKEQLSEVVENLSSQNQQGDGQQQNTQQGQNWQSGQNQDQNQQDQSWQTGGQQSGLQTDEQNADSTSSQYGTGPTGDPLRPIH
jgi:ElaB/YqjD/DUF883 family membrane-anchored ribosome-binding protein